MSIIYNLGGYGNGGGGGGRTGGGSSSSSGNTITSFVPFLENGGFQATAYLLFVPTQSSSGGNAYISTFVPTNYDDPNDGSTYFYRMEDVIIGRMPAVRRLIIIHRDLGPATITAGVRGTDDTGAVIFKTATVQLGTTNATSNLVTAFADIQIACFRPQPYITRAAGAGPVSIVSLTMIGEVEEVSL